MDITLADVAGILSSIKPEQRERFKGRAVRYHGPFVMRANGRIEDLRVEERPENVLGEGYR